MKKNSNKKVIKEIFDEQFDSKTIKKEKNLKCEKRNFNSRKKLKWVLVIICLVIILFLLFGVNRSLYSENNNNVEEEKNTTKKETKIISIPYSFESLELAYDISDPIELAEHSDYIAIIRIDSIDGSARRNRVTNNPVLHIYSYGTATLLKTLKGNINNDKIKYRRSGGILSYLEWIESDIDPDKLLSMVDKSQIDGVPIEDVFVEEKMQGDIDIEENKTYLVYMYRSSNFDKDGEYIIQGYQYGFREVKATVATSSGSIKNYIVKNNETGEWENLSDIVVFYDK